MPERVTKGITILIVIIVVVVALGMHMFSILTLYGSRHAHGLKFMSDPQLQDLPQRVKYLNLIRTL